MKMSPPAQTVHEDLDEDATWPSFPITIDFKEWDDEKPPEGPRRSRRSIMSIPEGYIPMDVAMDPVVGPTVEVEWEGTLSAGEEVGNIILTKRDHEDDEWEVVYMTVGQAEWVARKLASAILELRSLEDAFTADRLAEESESSA